MTSVRSIPGLIVDVEEAVGRIDGLLEAAYALDWQRPTLHDGEAVNAVIASALMQVDIATKALRRIRELNEGGAP